MANSRHKEVFKLPIFCRCVTVFGLVALGLATSIPPSLQAQTPALEPTPLVPEITKPTPQEAPPLAADEARQNNRLPPDLLYNLQPLVIRAEAHQGFPFGIGRISFRMRQGDEMLLRTGAVLLTERNRRVF